MGADNYESFTLLVSAALGKKLRVLIVRDESRLSKNVSNTETRLRHSIYGLETGLTTTLIIKEAALEFSC